ncbi:L-Aspartase-like protein [Pseudomassariella vexata]|uniref:L-Aspartase-like protein n=1 Tax=Pseudomassariella vexata TaxID=1141098 RepID=A0A1Y2DJA0_9PEZI|nr:L-Aspartase-like protein [Pseudomassariella vexata]ORY58885.1 L-Aspartase-like protein [Pseudomassariella vexata]
MSSFTSLVLTNWQELELLCAPSSQQEQAVIPVTSRNLTVAQVVAVSRRPLSSRVRLTNEALDLIAKCSNIVTQRLAEGSVIYGVNTGFGGSADTRTKDVIDLQQSIYSHLMFGILAGTRAGKDQNSVADLNTLALNDEVAATWMPESWARASMLVRLNSLAGGDSGIRICVAENLVQLLNKDIVPRIPLHGSISASGDLSPLSYVGAVMQGKPNATAFAGDRRIPGARRVVRADVALAQAGIKPTDVRAKEGLAIVNGTAVSAGVAAIALHESINLAALAQVLTAMSVEALLGTDESFDPFIAQVRPHPGQVDSARNIFAFLAGSQLVTRNDNVRAAAGELRQDRYSIRTASQWIGPVLEDFMLAHAQILCELNSVTDNPLIDASRGRIFHGGNFQAKAITSAVEKLRQGLQSLGRMLFSQVTELINPVTNRDLPPNLVADDPSCSYLFKGVDVGMAALASELGFLANPVGTHVLAAEMGNQSINSLALVSSRYTMDSVAVLSQLIAFHILAVCQALDLRTRALSPEGKQSVEGTAANLGSASKRVYEFVRKELCVPFLTEAVVGGAHAARQKEESVGTFNTAVYEAIRSGRLYRVVIQCFEDVATASPPGSQESRKAKL